MAASDYAYARERDLRSIAGLDDPEFLAQNAATESLMADANSAELDKAIRSTRDPRIIAELMAEKQRMAYSGPVEGADTELRPAVRETAKLDIADLLDPDTRRQAIAARKIQTIPSDAVATATNDYADMLERSASRYPVWQPVEQKAEPSGVMRRTADIGLDLVAQGPVALGESVVGIGDLMSGGLLGDAMSAIGYDSKRTKEFIAGFYSPERKAIEAELATQDAERNKITAAQTDWQAKFGSEAEGALEKIVALGGSPTALLGRIAQSAPGMLAAGGVAGKVFRELLPGATAAAEAAGLTGTALTDAVSAAVAPAVRMAAAGAEGAQAAGSIAVDAKNAGRTWDQYALPAIGGGAITTLVGLGVGAGARKLGVGGDIETSLATGGRVGGAGAATGTWKDGRLAHAGLEAVKEGLFEEGGQSFNEAVAGNLAEGKPWYEGVGGKTGEGVGVGAAQGGGHALVMGTHSPERVLAAPTVDAAIAESEKVVDTYTNPGEAGLQRSKDYVEDTLRMVEAQTKAAEQNAPRTETGLMTDADIPLVGQETAPLEPRSLQSENPGTNPTIDYANAMRKSENGEIISSYEAALLNGPNLLTSEIPLIQTETKRITTDGQARVVEQQMAALRQTVADRVAAGDTVQDEINRSTGKFSTERETAQEAVNQAATAQNKYAPAVEVVPITAFSQEASPREDSQFQMMSQSTAQTLRRFGQAIGKEIVFYRSTDTMEANQEKGLATLGGGFVTGPDKIYIRADHLEGAVSPLAILGHEWLHQMKTASAPMYDALKSAIFKSGVLNDNALTNFYRDYHGFDKSITDTTGTTEGVKHISDADIGVALKDKQHSDNVLEEFVADISGNRFTEHGFWMDVFEHVEEKPMIVKLGRAILGFVNGLLGKESFNKFAADTDVKSLMAVRGAVVQAMTGYLKQQGVQPQKIAEAVYGKREPVLNTASWAGVADATGEQLASSLPLPKAAKVEPTPDQRIEAAAAKGFAKPVPPTGKLAPEPSILTPKQMAKVERKANYPTPMERAAQQGARLKGPEDSRVKFSEERTPYGNAPDGLMGYGKFGPPKAFGEQRYKHAQYVRVTQANGATHVDAVTGLNGPHALERARRNWSGATVTPITEQEAVAEDPTIAEDVKESLRAGNAARFSSERGLFSRLFGKKAPEAVKLDPIPTNWVAKPSNRAKWKFEASIPGDYQAGNGYGQTPEDAIDNAKRGWSLNSPNTREQMPEKLKPVEVARRPRKDNLDPEDTEASQVEAGIRGKSMLDAARFVADNGSPAERAIADRVHNRLSVLQASGVKLNINVVHLGDTIPSRIARARGAVMDRVGKPENDLTMWLNGHDVSGKSGMSYETVLHELVHAATMASVRLGNLQSAKGTPLAQNVSDLYDVGNAIIAHFKARDLDVRQGYGEHTEFEKQIKAGANNAFKDADEVLAWALSSPEAQTYLESVPYKSKSLWTAFVAAVRNVLGLSASADTALSEVLRISEALLGDTAAPVADGASEGKTVTTKQSTERIAGDSGRAYTAAQKAAFQNTGRTVTEPTLPERIAGLRKDLGKKLTQGMVDQFAPVKDISEYAYRLLRLTKGTAGAVEAILHHGKLNLKNGVYDADQSGGWIERIGKPLQGEAEDFLWWVAGNRAERLSKEDRENLFSPTDIAAYKSLNQGDTKFDYEIQNGPKKGQTTRNRAEIYRDALTTFDGFNKNVLDMAEQSGLIDGAARKYWEHEFYVPFFRESEESGEFIGGEIGNAVVRQKAFERLKGGKDKLNSDLLANTLANMSHIIDAAAKNRAAKETLEAAVTQGAAQHVPASYPAKNKVWYMGDVTRTIPAGQAYTQNGQQLVSNGSAQITTTEKIHLIVSDPYVLAAISSLEFTGLKGPLMDALSAMKHALTIGVAASPAFKIRNLIRDSIQAIGTSELGYNPVANIKEGIAASARDSQTYVSALASGALIKFGTMEGKMADKVRRLIDQGVDSASILDTDAKVQAVWNKMRQGWDAYQELGNRGEEINRAALYSQLIKNGMDHGEAALQARDLMDFSLQGSWQTIRFLSQVVPFFNARLQGLYKLGRGAKEDPAKFATILGAIAVAAIGAMLYYKDDDDWKKRDDSDRDNFLWFKVGGKALRIPMPFEMGAIATVAMRGVEYFASPEMTGERFKERLWKILGDNLAMNPLPQAVKPILDIYANKDSFTGQPIEKLGQDKLRAEQRFNADTSVLARGLSTAQGSVERALGVDNMIGILSPVQIDHAIRGYFGWLGSFVVGAGDMMAQSGSWDAKTPSRDMWKFATQNIIQDANSPSSRYVSQMYQQAKSLEEAYATYRSLLKQGQGDEARAYREDHIEELRKYPVVEAVKKQEARFNEQIKLIERSSSLDSTQKRERILAFQNQKSRVAQRLSPGA